MTNTAAKALAIGSNPALEYAMCSDIGLKRTMNQDSFEHRIAEDGEFSAHGHLFVVADGMGAHAAGELASRLAVEEIRNATGPEDHATQLGESFQKANSIIHEQGQSNPELYNMGTTCSALWLLPAGAIIGHVGDSRIYRCRRDLIEQLTFDHSLVWEMRAAGQFAGDSAATIPRNVITRCLGPHPRVEIDLEGPFSVEVGDVFLLCSDGLTGRIEDAELGVAVRYLPPRESAEFLVDLANLRGGHDNITVTIVRINAIEAQSVGKTIETSPTEKSDTHPGWWFLAGLGMVITLLGVAFRTPIAGAVGACLLLGPGFVVATEWLRHRRHTTWTDGLRVPPYAKASSKINERFVDGIADTFRAAAEYGDATIQADIAALSPALGNADPIDVCQRIRSLAQRLRNLDFIE